ncbi:helix-turn-helix transcriptional regulator [Mycolicibacterium vaccae]|uniref:helix-turn-helix transcriptional regulator n=1 Tax=Mycolicibacterium vaccae TaxID=1810 RepID=UPI003D059188
MADGRSVGGDLLIGPMVLTRHRIRIARTTSRLTQAQLGRKVGVAMSTVRDWESGKHLPGLYELSKIARETGCDVEWLLQGGGAVPRICCPVCWREVSAIGPNRTVVAHNDNARWPCPMTGHPAPIEPAAAVGRLAS